MTDNASIISSPTGDPVRNSSYAAAQIVGIEKRLWGHGTTYSLVQERFDLTTGYADTAYNITLDYIETMNDILKELETYNVPNIEVDTPTIPGIDYTARPAHGDLALNENWPANTAVRPDIEPYPSFMWQDIPLFNIPDPDINMPERPQPSEILDPGEAPLPDPITLPPAPGLNLPDVPTLNEVLIPGAPDITIPEFDAIMKEEVLPDPQALSWEEAPYSSEIWAPLLGKVIDGILYGGTGLGATVEDAIWQRAQNRLDVKTDRTYQEISNFFGAKGWAVPPGALAGRLQQAAHEIDRENENLTFDIAAKQAELAQTNTHFVMDKGREMEVITRDFHNNQQNRSLEAAKTIAQHSIEVLNAYINKQNAYIEKYKADAMVYESRVKAVLTQIEIYKAQVEGAKVTAETQQVLVELYGKQVDAAKAIIGIYQAEVESAKILAEIEKIKIQSFAENVRIFTARLDAERLKYDAYSTGVQAEKVHAEIYGEKVKAYGERVSAYEADARAKVARLEAIVKGNQGEIDRYRAELSAYSTEVEAEAKRIGGIVEAFRGEVAAYSAETTAEAARYQALGVEINAAVAVARMNLDKEIARIDSATKGYVAIKQLEMEGTKGIMDVSAQLAASAMGAVGASATMSYNGGENMNANFHYGAQLQESHSFSHPTPQLN